MAANREIGDTLRCEYRWQASNAAWGGCHSTGQLAMSDKQTTVSNDTPEKVVCPRNSRMAVAVPKGIYVNPAWELHVVGIVRGDSTIGVQQAYVVPGDHSAPDPPRPP